MTTHPEETTTPLPSARRKWGLSAAGVLIPLRLLLVALGLYLHRRWAEEEDLRQAIAETDRLDPNWTLHDLMEARTPVADEENSAPVVLAAWGLMPRPWPPTLDPSRQPEGGISLLDLLEEWRLNAQHAEDLQAALKTVEAATAKARKLADLPRGRHVVAWSKDYIGTTLPHIDAARQVARLLAYDAIMRAHEGDIDEALTSARAALNAGRSVGDEPCLVSQLFRLAARAEALGAGERAIAQGEASPAVLESLQRLLEDEERQPLLLLGLRGERAGMHQGMQVIETGQFDRAGYGMQNPLGLPDRAMDVVDAVKARATHAAYLRFLNQLVEIAKLPPEQQKAEFDKVHKPELDLPMIMEGLGGDEVKPGRYFLVSLARLRCAIAGVAAERFRLAKGRWPDSLAEMRPDYLAAVPFDPFGGASLRFVRLEDGLVIYSLGPDGKDNGGDLARNAPILENQDVGFRLWNVDRRRQPAP